MLRNLVPTTILRIPQGTSWTYEIPVTDEQGDPADLTGYRARGQVRRRPSGLGVLYEWDSDGANCELTDDGVVRLTLEPAETAGWTFRKAVFDLELTDPDGSVSRIASGRILVDREVTRG